MSRSEIAVLSCLRDSAQLSTLPAWCRGELLTAADLIDQLRQRVVEVEAKRDLNARMLTEELTRNEHLEAKLALAEQDVAALRGFAQAVMECWPEGDVDGGYLQDMAEKHGLLRPEERTIPCGENCGCAEFYMSGEVATCYRGTPLLRGAAIDASGEK